MASLPTYDPAGTKLTDRQQANPVNADMFGGSAARALAQAGEQVAGLGDDMMRRQKQEQDRQAITDVTDAHAEGVKRMRHALYDEGGIYSRQGKSAEGMTDTTMATADTIFNDVSKRLTNPRAQQAFKNMWGRYSEGIANSAATKEFNERQATRTAVKTAALAEITNDVIANYNDEEVLAGHFATTAEFIAANADGAPPEVVAQMQRETASAMHLAVIQRISLDDPGRALAYYERHRAGISGVDHTKASAMISGVQQARDAKLGADEIANGGTAGDIVRSVIGAESSGDPGAVSDVGAAGLMQLMPKTAREVAASLGMSKIAAMDDAALQAYWKTPEGRKANVRLGTTFLNKQLVRFDGDLEAALVAYNAGPENAEKFLNAGRDYAALPMPEQTLPYVQKVLGSYTGQEITGTTSRDIQRAIGGGGDSGGGRTLSYGGDARGFLLTKLQSQHGPASIDSMSPMLQQRLAAMMSEAPDFVKDGLDLLSGARTWERQNQLFAAELKRQGGNVAAARKNVAPASGTYGSKGSQHEHGHAADLGWKGGKFAGAPKEVREWIHANAARYGLKFPMGWEPWHIETSETRGGAAAKGDRPNMGDVATARVQRAWAGNEDVRVEVDNEFVNPADVYTKFAGTPYSVPVDIGSLDSWLMEARERYAGNPSMLAEVERQLTDEHKMRTNRAEAAKTEAMTEIFRGIVQEGKSVRDYDPMKLVGIGNEGVNKLLEAEKKWKGDDAASDPAAYYRLSQMTPEELAGHDMMNEIPNLSVSDWKVWVNKQAELKKPNASAAKRETDLTRTQITGLAENMLGLKPASNPEDASRMALLQRAFNSKIDAFVEQNKKEPNGTEMQAMMDELLLTGKTSSTVFSGLFRWTSDKEVPAFEMTPQERATATVVDTFDEIPVEAHGEIARGYRNVWKIEPNEEAAVDFYNDMARVKFGGAPLPPAAMDAKIRQSLATAWGRPPSTDEVAAFYRELIIRATAK